MRAWAWGVVFGSLVNSISRNPSLKGELFRYIGILGFALTEAVGLLALMDEFFDSFSLIKLVF